MNIIRATFGLYEKPKAGDIYELDNKHIFHDKPYRFEIIGVDGRMVNYKQLGLTWFGQNELATMFEFAFCYNKISCNHWT